MLTVATSIKPSRIHGVGLFAAEPIAAGDPVWRFDPTFDLRFSRDRVESAPAMQARHIAYYGFLSRTTREHFLSIDDSRFMNHSLRPTASVLYLNGASEPLMVARHDIASGDELTVNYFELCHPDDIALAEFETATVRSIGPRRGQVETPAKPALRIHARNN